MTVAINNVYLRDAQKAVAPAVFTYKRERLNYFYQTKINISLVFNQASASKIVKLTVTTQSAP